MSETQSVIESRRRRGPGGRVLRSREATTIVALLAGALVGCSSQTGNGGGDNTQVAVRNSEARYADTLSADRLPSRGQAWVVFEADTVVAEVAATSSAREEGLMYRRQLAEGTGMLFVFQNEAVRSFWMRNTYVPLDIAFLDQAMVVVDIQQMEPESDEYHTSSDPAMFALEVPRGWLAEHGVEEGAVAEIVFGPR